MGTEFAPRGRGRGRGRGQAGWNSNTFEPEHRPEDADGEEDRALQLLVRRIQGSTDNPYLKPIKFVKSEQVLFEDKEEIFKAEVAEVG